MVRVAGDLRKMNYTKIALLTIDIFFFEKIYDINNNVKAIVEQYETIVNNSLEFESHKHVIDIQCPIIGQERVFWSPITDMKVKKLYESTKDITIYSDPLSSSRYVDILF